MVSKDCHPRPWLPKAAPVFCLLGLQLWAPISTAIAQDVRGMEICTAEKQMERRTGCLQANVEFLEQELKRLASDTHGKMASANRDLSNARDEIAMLKATVEKLSSELAQLKATSNTNSKK
jgi:predicted RNase H-like nuclease (RuvC/YqgF family)